MFVVSVPIILASQSPRRAYLLNQLGLKFTVHPSNIDEEIDNRESYEENVCRLSLHKAENVSLSFEKGLVIGSDTIVVIDEEILGKPTTKEEAFSMLKTLSGRTHSVYTGFAIVDAATKKSYIDYEKTNVTFRSLSDVEITDYIDTGSPMDKAGAYGIQDDFGAVFVEKISGCYYTVVGFPLAKFYVSFKKFAEELRYLRS